MMRRRQGGSLTLDMVLGGAVGMVLLGVFIQVLGQLKLGRAAFAEGERLKRGADAMQAYLQDHGAAIATSTAVSGFAQPAAPTLAELQAAAYLPPYFRSVMPLGGNIMFVVRPQPNGSLIGLACDDRNISKAGQPSPALAAQVMAASGRGLMTSALTPALLNGRALQNVAAPVSGPAIVCAWATAPNPAAAPA